MKTVSSMYFWWSRRDVPVLERFPFIYSFASEMLTLLEGYNSEIYLHECTSRGNSIIRDEIAEKKSLMVHQSTPEVCIYVLCCGRPRMESSFERQTSLLSLFTHQTVIRFISLCSSLCDSSFRVQCSPSNFSSVLLLEPPLMRR